MPPSTCRLPGAAGNGRNRRDSVLIAGWRIPVGERGFPDWGVTGVYRGSFSFEDERLGQGRQNATFLKEHPDVCTQILARIQAQVGEGQIVSARLLPMADGTQAEAAPVAAESAESEVAPAP